MNKTERLDLRLMIEMPRVDNPLEELFRILAAHGIKAEHISDYHLNIPKKHGAFGAVCP